jgi:4'-phosphopantetheinyl transferase
LRQHQSRFIARRGVLRAIVGHYLQTEPAQVEFEYNAHGKHALSPAFNCAGVHFNLSHLEQMTLLTVTTIGPVGIDVESIRVIKDARELISFICSPRECKLF